MTVRWLPAMLDRWSAGGTAPGHSDVWLSNLDCLDRALTTRVVLARPRPNRGKGRGASAEDRRLKWN